MNGVARKETATKNIYQKLKILKKKTNFDVFDVLEIVVLKFQCNYF